jgi:hypothetical protein
MVVLASLIACLALAGALASWAAGAWFYARTLRALSAEREQARARRLTVLAWPFALKRLQGTTAVEAASVNKALVAFFACLMIAAAATSVATNLARVSR